MRLFIREHIPLIIVQLVQFGLIVLVYWLDGYRNMPIALYSVFLGLILLMGYLVFRYISHRSFYRKMSEPPDSLDESLQSTGNAPLPAALDEVLAAQYRHCQNLLITIEKKRNAHAKFMNQWVHQMKTPLSVIHLTTQDADDPGSESIREELERIEKGLEMVLYLARLETFEQDFKVEQVSLRKAVEQVIHENKRYFIRNYVYPEVKVDPVLHVETDAKWLHFMLNQLISNAIRYSAGSNEKITFDTSMEAGQRIAILEIRDRGAGIASSDLKRVFQPFFTGKNGRKFRESTGMGLYFVHEVCRQLGHRIEMQSEEGQGTTAKLIFTAPAPYLTEM